jgi:hypothetical protein
MITSQRPYRNLDCLSRTAVFGIACLLWTVQAAQAADPATEFLDDAFPNGFASNQGWGTLGINTAVKPTDRPAMPLRIGKQEYQHGLGHHANGEIIVALEGQYKTFDCEVGLQWQGGTANGSVVFQVFVDDKKVFDSGVMRENDPPKKVHVSVEFAEELRLVVDNAGDGFSCDCADWVDARLTKNPDAKAALARESVDLAPFGRVVTSDPKRQTGTAATRLQEFPAADISLETDLKPSADGSYSVAASAEGQSAIGLRWPEMRFLRRLELRWPEAAKTPSPDSVQLQYWVGVSPWQGAWKPLTGKFESTSNVWTWQITGKDQPAGTVRVRWLFSGLKESIKVKGLSAFGRSVWNTTELRAELEKPVAGKKSPVIVSNGVLLPTDAAASDNSVARSWDLSQPLLLKVRYSKPKSFKADRTVLRFELPQETISVAVEDVLANGCVWAPSAGLFVTTNPPKKTLAQYRQEIAGKKSVLEDVRQRPDQTFADAMTKTRNPVQNNGPTLLSLSCDNRKYVVGAEGRVCFRLYDVPDGDYTVPNFDPSCFQCVPQFGSGKGTLSRHLDGGWLPKPVSTVEENGIRYQQCTYVAPIDAQSPAGSPSWYRQRAACVVQYTIENTQQAEADVALQLQFSNEGKTVALSGAREIPNGLVLAADQRLMAYFDAASASPLNFARQADAIKLAGKLPGGKSAKLTLYLPAWSLKPEEFAVLQDAGHWSKPTEQYWQEQLAGAIQVDVPDPLLVNVIRASQMHCLLAAHNEEHGAFVSPWIASAAYGPLESESQAVIRGMDLCGQTEFARRGLNFFLKRINPQGFLTTGYTVVGTGEHLWTAAEHFARTGDTEWLKKAAPELVRACRWIVANRAKTKGHTLSGENVAEYGLMPPGVSADWDRFAYRLFNDTQYCHGLETVAAALTKINHPEAAALQAEGKAYREDLLQAYRKLQVRCPVVPLNNGTWVQNHPAMLDVFGNVEEFVPAEDANRSWCYSVEIGTHHMAANGFFDPQSREVAQIMDYLEDHQFLRSGWFDYPEEKNRQDVFNLGGFAKVQPYYARNAEICALRDDVKPYIRSYFNALSAMLNAQNLSLWEHFHNGGAWNKTHETGWYLCQTAILFSMDRGDDLWLAPFVTNRWLEDGKKVAVRNAPSRFGPVSYAITSAAASGHIDATIEPPTRETPKHLVLRVRHPDGKPIRSVTVNGKPHQDFDPQRESITLAPSREQITVRVDY